MWVNLDLRPTRSSIAAYISPKPHTANPPYCKARWMRKVRFRDPKVVISGTRMLQFALPDKILRVGLALPIYPIKTDSLHGGVIWGAKLILRVGLAHPKKHDFQT